MIRRLRIVTFCVMQAMSVMAAMWLPGIAWGQAGAGGAREMLAAELRKLDTDVLPADRREELSEMLSRDLRERIRAANQTSTQAWRKIATREDWESFRSDKLAALARSLGTPFEPADRKKLEIHVSRTRSGDGFQIENLVFASRQGLWITANLYRPLSPSGAMPGIVICHSHHTPKTHGELQDMGMTWARNGCLVLVMDQIGHGERRAHPFASAADYPGEFAVSRQDYYFRYDNGIQLHLAGESLIGQIAWDLRRGADLLLAQQGIDPERIILLGSVAGGGDPAAVAAALDERFAAAVPFNFGGPQPETRYPLPDDAELLFNYAGSGGWESTRNLRHSAAEGFLPWVIVAGIAPRKLIYAHEFSWDRQHDPVWQRLQQIYQLYDTPGSLDYVHGFGSVQGRPPDASHCTHIGRLHRERIHQALRRWFGIDVAPEEEYSNRLPAEELLCLTGELRNELQFQPLYAALKTWRTGSQGGPASSENSNSSTQLASAWQQRLGKVEPDSAPAVVKSSELQRIGERVTLRRVVLEVEPGITVPLVLLIPAGQTRKPPAVLAVAQEGKKAFLQQRTEILEKLLSNGIAVCLPDVRGTGETRPSDDRSRRSWATSLSSSELMLGGTMVGARLRDLRSVLRFLETCDELDSSRVLVWGDSFADVNPAGTDFQVPRAIDDRTRQSEPLGGLLALFAGLYEDSVSAICVHGGLTGFRSVREGPRVNIPHDVVIPGAIPAGDLTGVAASLAPRPLLLAQMVDGNNQRVTSEQSASIFAAAREAYRRESAGSQLVLVEPEDGLASWMIEQLQQRSE